MKLTVFNGSGRGKNSNSTVLLDAFLKGFTSVDGCTSETHILMHASKMETFTTAFANAEHVLLIFPMYTDMIPAVVKAFIETLEPLCGRAGNPSMAYMVHCGFPEGVQMRALESYLAKLSRRLGCRHAGVIRKGNSEGVRETPPEKMTGLLGTLETLGKTYAQTGELDGSILTSLSQPERLPGAFSAVFKVLTHTPITKGGWDKDLKKNGAYRQRFARPDLEEK